MADSLSNERNELQEDDEKLQIALNEFDNQWDEYYSEDEEEEDEEEQLLIDLDYETSQQTVHSNTPSFAGSASRSQSLTAADEESGEAVPRPNLELPSQINLIEHRDDPQKTLHLNRILQGILEKHINDIKEALKENKEKQEKLLEDATNYSTKQEKKSVYSGSFRAPYFRHDHSYPPSNEDVTYRKVSDDYEIVTVDSIKELRQFKRGAKELLRVAVLEDYMEQMLKPVVTKMELEIKKRDKCIEEFNSLSFKLMTENDSLKDMEESQMDFQIEQLVKEGKEEIAELETKMEEKRKLIYEHKQEVDRLEKEIQNKRSIPEDEILKTVDTEKVDWMKIAKKNFGGHNSWLDCQKAWENLVSPAINKKTWTKEDDKKLLDLVKSTSWDWKEVAKAMGNGRTPFQCFSHYQQHFNSDFKPRPWTSEEDARLVRVTNNVRDSVGFFAWSKVSTLMDSRSPVECMCRFTKVDTLQHRGRWTELEDAKLLAAVEMIGPCWSKVAKFICTRNMVQCRDRYINCLAPNINFSHFTYDEDVKLLTLYKKLGPAWSKMIPEFIGRTDNMLLIRYKQLQKWKQQNEWFQRQSDQTKQMLLGKSLTVAERHKYKKKAFGYITNYLGVAADDYKRQELDKQNGVDPDIIPVRPPQHLRCYVAGGPSKCGSLNKWLWKLENHKRLTENMHRLLENEALANNSKKCKTASTMPAEVRSKILNKTVEETLKENKQKKKVPRSKAQIKKLEAALNRVFLTEGTISVQELLNTSVTEKKKTRKMEMNAIIESELRDMFRRRCRGYSKFGRRRRFFEKDTRPLNVIDDELDELDHSVPLLLMKSFGTNIHYLCNAVRLQCLQAHEELLNQPSYENDADFKTKEAEAEAAIKKLLMRTGITDLYRQQQVYALNRKRTSLRRIFQEKALLESRIVENKICNFQEDLDYLESLVDERKEMEVNKNFLLMTSNPHGSLDTEFEVEVIEATTSKSLSKATFSSATTSKSLSKATPSSATTSESLSKATFSSATTSKSLSKATSSSATTSESLSKATSSSATTSESLSKATSSSATTSESLSKATSSSATTSSNEFAVPLLPPRRKRTRFDTRQSSNSCSEDEPANKRFKALTEQEIADKRRKLPDLKKRVFANLPYLPPSLSTMLGLRGLLYMKRRLIERAGRLYRPEHHGSNLPLSTDTTNEMQVAEGNSAVDKTDDIQMENTGSWFLYTNPQQLSEQARRYEGYRQHCRNPGETRETDQSSAGVRESSFPPQNNELDPVRSENEAFIIPLEERGGRLPDSGNRCGHNCDADMKPVDTEKGEVPAMSNAGWASSTYKVVMGYTGRQQQAKYSCGNRVMEDHQTSMNIPGNNSEPAVQNSVSIIPDCMIKADNTATPVSSTFYICNSSNDSARARFNHAPYSGNSCAPIETTSLLDFGAISLCPVGQTEGNIGNNDDDEVLAIINFDDDDYDNDNPADTVINICSGQANNMSGLNATNDQQIVIVSENGEDSYISAASQETNQASDLSQLELPESRVRSILSDDTLKNRMNRIVLVGVDNDSKTIVHYKSEEDRFKAYEAIPCSIAESDGSHYINLTKSAQPENAGMSQGIPDCMKTIRQTDEYKLLLARFKSLFMWPILMSTTKPSPLNDGSLPTKLSKAFPQNVQRLERQKIKRKRCTRKVSVAQREHLKLIRKASLATKMKRSKKMANISSAKKENIKDDDGNEEEMEGKSNSVRLKQQDKAYKIVSGKSGEASVASSDEASKPKKKTGRPIGSRNRKYQRPLSERPKRATKCAQEVTRNPLDNSLKEPVKSLPQWWKDAILASMLAKKAMIDDGDKDCEVNLEDDSDFIDTGNYSDDEWYQQLRLQETVAATQPLQETVAATQPLQETVAATQPLQETVAATQPLQETGAATQPSTEQACRSDPTALVLQDHMAEETMKQEAI